MGRAGWALADALGTKTTTLETQLTTELVSDSGFRSNGEYFSFEIDSTRKENLLKGLDKIGLTLQVGTRPLFAMPVECL